MGHQYEKGNDCVVSWVKSPVSGKWIEVNGKTWNKLYPKYKNELDKARQEHVRGKIGKDGTCKIKRTDILSIEEKEDITVYPPFYSYTAGKYYY